MTSKDLKVHAILAELLAYLDIDEDPEKCLDILSKRSASSKTSQLSENIALGAAKLSQNSPARFRSIYERLKNIKAQELDPLLFILQAFNTETQYGTPLKLSRSTGNVKAESTVVECPMQTPRNFEGKITPNFARSMTKKQLNTPGIDGTTLQTTLLAETNSPNDGSIAELAAKILPICSYHASIELFIEEHSSFEYGRVHHALASAMRSIVQEFHILVAQLENQSLTNSTFSLQKLLYYISPSMETFSNLDTLVQFINGISAANKPNCKSGGLLLTLLSDRMILFSGHSETRELYSYLLSKATKPYYELMFNWIYNGILEDTFNEFMIEERPTLSKDTLKEDFNDVYWEHRYSLRQDFVPNFLTEYSEKILFAGKYLNVLRECGKVVDVVQLDETKYDNDAKIIQEIEQGYLNANHALLELLFEDQHLISRLQSIKSMFLLEHSDYLTHFLDLAMPLLMKPAVDIPVSKIKTLMDLVIQSPSSACFSDPFKSCFTAQFCKISLFDELMKINSMVGIDMKKHRQTILSGTPFNIDDIVEKGATSTTTKFENLKGLDVFVLEYNVSFPLSLVLNRKTIGKYQILFRHLLKCKYVERSLSSTWLESKNSNSDGQISSLKAKMLHFIQQLSFYMFFEVIEPHWIEMTGHIKEAKTVDDLLNYHDDFLNICLKECMLTQTKLVICVNDLLNTCNTLSNLAQGNFKRLSYDDINSKFLSQIQILMDTIKILGVIESHSLINLLSQLDYNGYYMNMAPKITYVESPVLPVC